MKFFLDNNLGRQLADGMHAFGEDVTHILDHFKPDSRDTDWLPIVGEKQWILITRDERIRYNPLEKAELVSNGVGAFFLGGKNRSRCELIQQLVRNWPRIKELAGATKRPFAFRIPPSGTKMQRILYDRPLTPRATGFGRLAPRIFIPCPVCAGGLSCMGLERMAGQTNAAESASQF